MKKVDNQNSYQPQRRLSIPRLIFAVLVFAGLSYGTVFGWNFFEDVKTAEESKTWFAAYVDATAKPTFGFEQLGSSSTPHVVLSFIVSHPSDPCIPSWGAFYTLDEAREELDLDRRIARLAQKDGSASISFGGLLNDELAVECRDENKLLQAYLSVIERYKINTIDLDLENEGLTNVEAGERRARVIAKLQKQRRDENKDLAVWLTIPVAPQGLTRDGTDAVARLLNNKVDLAGINVMTMNYGSSKTGSDSMHKASKDALNQTHRQLGILYKQAGINLSNATLWTKIGATPMIGQNDVRDEVFTIADAIELNKFARDRNIGRMSVWSANRDIECGENYVDTKTVSDSCSGIKQDTLAFSRALSTGFVGDPKDSASIVTKNDPQANSQINDDPTSSPFQIWQEKATYLEGTKVVWHGNVYQAKWWTKGDMPDNPILQAWETPWQLIGPVLPGEDPIPQPTLPAGTYPTWNGNTEYEVNQRVLYEGIPYQAKWWSKGESPGAASADIDDSPWAPLTLAEIKEIIENLASE